MKIIITCSLLVVAVYCLHVNDLSAQTADQLIDNALLTLGQDSESPELGPVEFELIDAPGIAITEDPNGFMWFGGSDGLYRYDGHEYVHFRHEPQDSMSLSDNWVESLYADSEGMVWVGTFGGGLNRFDLETNTFTHFRHQAENPASLSQDTVTAIIEDSKGTLWIGTHGGLNRYDKKSGTFTRYLHDPEDPTSLSNNQVRTLYEDAEGTLWIGTGSPNLTETPGAGGGLNRFHPETQTFTQYLHDPGDSTSLINNKIMSLYEDSRGTFWVGTSGDGLHSMNRKTGNFIRHRFDPKEPTKLSRPFISGSTGVEDGCVGFRCGGVSFIHEDPHGILWIGGLEGGLNRYDLQTGAMSHHESTNSSLFDNSIWSAHESNDGTLWIGAWSGMYKVYASVNSFPLFQNAGDFIISFTEDSDHNIWIGNWYSSLYKIDRTNGFYTNYIPQENDSTSLHSLSVVATRIDPSGNLFVLYGNGGFSQYNNSKDSFEHFFMAPEIRTELDNSRAFVEDTQKRLWVGTIEKGLYQLDLQSETIVNHYTKIQDDSTSLIDNTIQVIHESKNGDLWIGTENGLNTFKKNSNRFSSEIAFQRFLEGKFINSVFEDLEGNIWIGTWGDGLYSFNLITGRSQHYSTSDGLPSDKVAAILEGDDDFFWISTSEGQRSNPTHGKISRFDPKEKSFINFGSHDGLPEIGFLNAALKTHDGLLFFGGVGGFTIVDPTKIHEPIKHSPKIALTGFRISNEEILQAPNGILERPVYLEDSIELSYQQNDVTFDYTAFSYSDSEQIQYEYQLKPYDSEWVSARSQRSARYSQIPPGEYQFRVRFIDGRGAYSANEAAIGIRILSPWWRTWWGYGLYALVFAAGVYAVDRFQRRRLIAKEREKVHERELEQAKEIERAYQKLETTHKKLASAHENLKSAQDQLVQQEKLASLGQLTAGIAHEIKNPLNFVTNFSDLSIEMIEEARVELQALSNQLATEDRKRVDETLEILDDVKPNLEKIQAHGKRADRIVKSMLQHSKGGTGKRELNDLNAIVKEFTNLSFHGMRASKQPIDVIIDLQLDDTVGKVTLIGEDFSRVIVNLCNNAFDAMREKLSENPDENYKPKLTVRTLRKEDTVTIEIQDNGPGIPDDIKDKILQPFFTTKHGNAGTGLGLSITHDIIKAHGGGIDIKSSCQGTIFSVTLIT
ncbi:hypothetical protein G3570_12095 [Balneolaceae bacterium YR4-1]|uniref:histidine kinase n=1 Tax=Halalkalibaculum roseum TaxID=2709311 RepID=A0A6M1SWF9_9BACT|nr:sensor histidine kinase [Halalkalibaculum roseum]NGP77380.1 hypothetical protein [Halalkalibaculum roseum]